MSNEETVTSVTINNTAFPIKEYQGNRVVTFQDIDAVHGRKAGTAKKNFQNNKEHLTKGEDYYEISAKEFRELFSPNLKMRGNPNNPIYLFTELGYLMIVKSLHDDLAWKVQRELVNTYFKAKEIAQNYQPVDTAYLQNQIDILNENLSILNKKLSQPSIAASNVPKAEITPTDPEFMKEMNPLFNALRKHYKVSYKKLLSNLYTELNNRYKNSDLKALKPKYCTDHNVQDCYELSIIADSPTLRKRFKRMVKNLVNNCDTTAVAPSKTIFNS